MMVNKGNLQWTLLLIIISVDKSASITQNQQQSIRELLIPSLFPNVAPYIQFPAPNESRRNLPQEIFQQLKWKGSGGVLRDVPLKAGFKLVDTKDMPLGGWGTPSAILGYMKNITGNNGTSRLKPYQKFRHCPGAAALFTKHRLAHAIHMAQAKFGKEVFDFIPTTFILPRDKKKFEKAWEENEDKFWIEKVPTQARGNGIKVITHPNEVTKKAYRVVQKYITDTFTLQGNKSHLTMYAMITSMNPLRMYVRDDLVLTVGLNKYSTDLESINNKCIHIPNFATFNKLECNEGYVMPDRTDEERKELHSEFYEMLKRNNMTKDDFMGKVVDSIIKSILAAKLVDGRSNEMPGYHSSKYNAYHWMSIDFAVDTKGNSYFLEVNYSPTMRTVFDGRRDMGLYKRRMMQISGALTLAGFQLPPTLSRKAKKMVSDVLNNTMEDPTFNSKLYRAGLTPEEKQKHMDFEPLFNSRAQYLDTILENLTPDDVRHLILAEDELNRSRFYIRIFPSKDMQQYFPYITKPYYYMLYDAYENKYGSDREAGRQMLANFAQGKYHLQP